MPIFSRIHFDDSTNKVCSWTGNRESVNQPVMMSVTSQLTSPRWCLDAFKSIRFHKWSRVSGPSVDCYQDLALRCVLNANFWFLLELLILKDRPFFSVSVGAECWVLGISCYMNGSLKWKMGIIVGVLGCNKCHIKQPCNAHTYIMLSLKLNRKNITTVIGLIWPHVYLDW